MDIDWSFRRGDVVKVRLVNERRSFHGMQHPIHFHGQRFLVLSVNDVPNTNLVWKDTVLLPAGSTAGPPARSIEPRTLDGTLSYCRAFVGAHDDGVHGAVSAFVIPSEARNPWRPGHESKDSSLRSE